MEKTRGLDYYNFKDKFENIIRFLQNNEKNKISLKKNCKWFLQNKCFMTLILNFSIISLLSLRGLLEMTGVLSSSNLIVLVLVLFGFITKCFSKKILLPFFGIFIIFLASGLISTLLSSTGLYITISYTIEQ